MKISKILTKNIDFIIKKMNNNVDVMHYDGKFCGVNYCIFYILDFVDSREINKGIIEQLKNAKKARKNKLVDYVKQNVLAICGQEKLQTNEKIVYAILEGNAVILFDGYTEVIKCAVTKFEQRNVAEPPTSTVVNGPREGFIENIKTNTILIRKRLPTKSLVIEQKEVGYYTKTKVNIVYIDDIADKKVINRVQKILDEIKIDGVLDANYIASYLEENKNSIFKQVGKAEKPDIVVAKILEGRVALIVDGSPIVLTVPFMLLEDLQNSDDYYQGSFKISLIRMIRYFGVIISMLLPGLYVAVQLYHYRLVPLKFLITLMNSIQGLPFSPFLEMLFVIILFEILYESSLRMPKYLGVALGIVGALILGDTAVKAGLISPPAVMIVAISGISFYMVPEQASQLSILRPVFTFVGGTIGIFGVLLGAMLLVVYLSAFNSYGTPYLAPYAPYVQQDLQDSLIKKDVLNRETRPLSIPSQKKKRIKSVEKE